jgi:class 3 adenylate cyclase
MAYAPSGTVTLLFTDIEGSTKLLQRSGERYAELLADHRSLLRAAFDSHDGYEIDTEVTHSSSSSARVRMPPLPQRRHRERLQNIPGPTATKFASAWACTPASHA